MYYRTCVVDRCEFKIYYSGSDLAKATETLEEACGLFKHGEETGEIWIESTDSPEDNPDDADIIATVMFYEGKRS